MRLLDWLISLFVRPAPPAPPPPLPPPVVTGDLVTRCIAAINAARAKAGKQNLGRDPRLCAAAQIQASYCALIDTMTHVGPRGSVLGDRLASVGYSGSRAAENAAEQPKPPPGWPGPDPRTPEWAVQGWMQSPGHRANLLGPYTQVGAAYADSASGTRYWISTYAVPSQA